MKKRFISFFILVMVLVISMTGCSSNVAEESNATGIEGSYTGSAKGYHGDISVTTEVDEDGKIINIVIGENTETEGVGTIAIEKVPQSIIEEQALDVDAVSGATITSEGIIKAVANSLESAGLDLVKYGYTFVEEEAGEVFADINKNAMPEKQKTTESITITDVKGRKVNIDLPISSYGISTMDVIDYIIPLKGEEAFDMLVASGQDGGGGLQKYAKLYTPVVGNYTEHVGQISDHNAPFDLEMVLATDPDVLIVNSAMAAHKYALEVEEQLNEAGISIVLIDVPGKTMDKSVQETIRLLGQIFQEEERAAEVASFIDSQYDLIASKSLSDKQDQPTVYYEKSGYAEIYGRTATSVSGWGMPIAIAGGENIADPLLLESKASGGSSNTLDPEYVIKADPQYIILSGINDGWLDGPKEDKRIEFDIVKRMGWSDLTAIKNGNVYEFAHSTSRSIYSFYPCLKMAKLFYSEEFSEVDPEAVLDEFFNRFMILDSDITTWFMTLEDSAL